MSTQPQLFFPEQHNRPWHWITIEGPDAQDFLHRITTVHVQALSIGTGSPGLILNAQGQIRAAFTLWHYDQQTYALELDGGQNQHAKDALLAIIDSLLFCEKLTVTEVTGLSCCWIFLPPSQPSGLASSKPSQPLPLPEALLARAAHQADESKAPKLHHTLAIDAQVRLNHHGSHAYGRPWITAWGRPEQLSAWLSASALPTQSTVDEQTLERWRIEAMSPRIDHEISDAVIPLEIHLQNAIAENKGCYPGQEVIERIWSQGSPPRRLVLLTGTGLAPARNTPLQNQASPPHEVGKITSVSPNATGFLALGLVRKIHAKPGLTFFTPSGQALSLLRVAPENQDANSRFPS